MSFASDVKKELTSIKVDQCCLKAELYQILRLRSSIVLNNKGLNLTIATTSLATARRITYLIKSLYGGSLGMLKEKREDLDRKSLYHLIVEEKGLIILKDLDLIDDGYNIIDTLSDKFLANDCCKASILRASFLMKGSINDPTKNNYHLELTLNSIEEASKIEEIISKVGIVGKTIERKKGFVLYIKKAEHIGDFLGYIGATNARFAFEDIRIKKDLSNYVNRIINCDVANEQKAMNSARKQIEDIEYINEKIGFLNMTPRLMNAIILRTTYPEDSLSQLSEKSEEVVGRYISKSGLSHCYRDIGEIADKIKNKL